MKPATFHDKLLGHLIDALNDTVGLREKTSLAALLQDEPEEEAAFLARPDSQDHDTPWLRMAYHFDLNVDVLILDKKLGTLGLVHILTPYRVYPKKIDHKAITHIREKINRFVDHATYVRHLLVNDPNLNNHFPLTVELVIITRDTEIKVIGDTFREIAQQSDYLHHIGVNILRYHSRKYFEAPELRRAFSWLLQATRQWYQSENSRPPQNEETGSPPDAAPNGTPLKKIELNNYRLQGLFSLEFDENARLHLVHGHNGSGKSSLCEAFEFVITGTVKRLDRELGLTEHTEQTRRLHYYAQAIQHRRTEDPATITLTYRNGQADSNPQEPIWTLNKKNKKEPVTPATAFLRPTLKVTSFRLNQKVMDDLTEQSARRAKIFLDSYFARDAEILNVANDAEKEAAEARNNLQTVLNNLTTARDILVDKNKWKAPPPETEQRYKTILDDWLELCVISDLASKNYKVAQTFREAGNQDWRITLGDAEHLFPQITFSPKDLQDLRAKRDDWEEALDRREGEVLSFDFNKKTKKKKADAKHEGIADKERRALDAVESWLFSSEETAEETITFGEKVNRAVYKNVSKHFAGVGIGEKEGWAASLIKDLKAMIKACEDLKETAEISPPWPGKTTPEAFSIARQKHETWSTKARAVDDAFLQKLEGDFSSAINELMALTTPARWAYEDFTLRYQKADGRDPSLTLQSPDATDEIPANARLNTAELSLFAITLFLLCARRNHNPFNLLILDDPLKNMDELTVIAMARGLAKVLRLWEDEKWQLLVLLHGQGDVDRLSREVPSTVYALPWLSPARQGNDRKAERLDKKSHPSTALQRLDDLIEYFS